MYRDPVHTTHVVFLLSHGDEMHGQHAGLDFTTKLPVLLVILALLVPGIVAFTPFYSIQAEESGCVVAAGETECAPCKTTPSSFSFPVEATIDKNSAEECEGTRQGPVTTPTPTATNPTPTPDPRNYPPGGWFCKNADCIVIYDARGRETMRSPPGCGTPKYCFKKRPSRTNGVDSGAPSGDPLGDVWKEYRNQVEERLGVACQCNVVNCNNSFSCTYDEDNSTFWLDSFTTEKDADGDCVMNGVVTGKVACKGRCVPRVLR